MRKIIKLLIVIPILLILTGCPASQFYKYLYITNIENEALNLKEINQKIELHIQSAKCGIYYEFGGKKERSLIVGFDSINEHIKFVNSKNYGNLEEVINPNLKTAKVYKKEIKYKSYNKIQKKSKNDTITIEFENGLKYYYIYN